MTLGSANTDTTAVALADLNNDGFLDLIIANAGTTSDVLLNQGVTTGSSSTWSGFGAPIALATTAGATSIALGDVTGDGFTDLVLGETAATPQLFENLGSGGSATAVFKPGVAIGASALTATGIALASFEGSSQLDLLVGANTNTTLYPGSAVPVTRIGFSGVTASLTPSSGSDSGTGASPLSLTNGQGAFILTSAGVAGTFSGTVSANVGTTFNANATASVSFNSTPSAIDETVVVGGVSIPVVFDATQCESSATGSQCTAKTTPYINVSGSGSISLGNFIEAEGTFSAGTGSPATISNVTVFVGQGPAFTDSQGTLNPTARGVLLSGVSGQAEKSGTGYAVYGTGTARLVGISGVTLSGTVTLETNNTGGPVSLTNNGTTVNPTNNTFDVTVTDAILAVDGVTLTGSFGVSYDGTNLTVTVTNLSLGFGPGTTTNGTTTYPVSVSMTSGTLTFGSAGVYGEITGASITLSLTGITSDITSVDLAINTTSAAQTVGADTLAPNSLTATGTGSVTVEGQQLQGTFAFQQVTVPVSPQAPPGSTPTTLVEVAVSNLSITLGTSSAGVAITKGSGLLLATSAGIAGQFSGTVTFNGLPAGTVFTGTFAVQVNTTTLPVSQQFQVGGTSVNLTLPAGPYFQVTGTGVQLTIAGQSLSGTFSVTDQSGTVMVAASNVSASFGDGANALLAVSGGTGTLTFGTSGGMTGNLSANVTVSIPGVTLIGTLRLSVTTTSTTSQVTVTGTDIALSFLGQTLTGSFSFEETTRGTSRVVEVIVTSATIPLGGFGTVSISTGSLLLTNGGVAGALALSANLTAGPVTLAGNLQLQINTTKMPANVPTGATTTTEIPAGPYMEISGTNESITVAGVTLQGSFAVQQSTAAGQTEVTIAATGVQLSLGSTLSDVLTDGQGLFVVLPTGIAGELQGTVNASGLVPGVQFSGTFGFAINETGAAVTRSLSVGGQTVSLNLAAGNYAQVSGTGVVLSVLGQTLTGNFGFESSNGTTVQLTASNVSLSLGDGTTNYLSLTNGQGSFTVTSGTGGGINGLLGGTVAVNVPGVASLTTTMSLSLDTTKGANSFVDITATNISLTILGQTISGNFAFSDTAGVIQVTITNLSLFLGSAGTNATPCATGATGATGLCITQSGGQSAMLTISKAGVSGDIAATVNFVGLPSDISFGNGIAIDVQFSPGSLLAQLGTAANPQLGIAANPVTVTVLGQSLSGVFSFERATTTGAGNTSSSSTVIKIAASDVNLFLGEGGVGAQVTNGSGLLLIEPDGVAGQVTAGVSINLGSVGSASAPSVTVTFNALATGGKPEAVNTQFTVGGATQTLALAAGHYLDVAARGVTITIAGQTLSTDLTVADNANLNTDGTIGTGDTITIEVSNGSLKLGTTSRTFVAVTNVAGTLTIASGANAGVYGSVTADVAVNIPGITLGGAFSVSLNTTGTGQTVTLPGGATLPVAPGVVVGGSGISLGILGQTLTGSVTFGYDPVSDTTYIAVAQLSLSLGDGTNTFVTASASGAIILRNSGIAAQLTATITLGPALASSNFSLSNASVTIAFNNTNAAVDETFAVGATGSTTNVTVDVPGGPFLRVEAGTEGNPVSIMLDGQALTAHVWFEQVTAQSGAKVVTIGFDDTSLTLGTSTVGVSITDASGLLVVSPGEVAGQLSGTPHLTIPNLSLTTNLTVEFNNSASAVNDTYSYTDTSGNSVTQTLNLQAGPYLRISAYGTQLTIDNSITLGGDFFFQDATQTSGATTTHQIEIGVANLSYNGSTSFGAISNARGALIITSSGVAGVLLGTISAAGSGLSLNASAGLEVNTTGQAVNQTVTVNGTAITVNVPVLASPFIAFVAEDVNINLDNVVEIYGNFTLTAGSFTGSGLQLFVGSGPYENSDGSLNAGAIGVLVDQATLSFAAAPGASASAGQYALNATGTLKLVGLDGLSVSGDVTFEINTTSSTLDGVAPNTFELTVTNADVNIAGVVDLSGSLAITRAPDGTLTLAIVKANLAITVSGQQVFAIGGSATFTISPTTGFHMQSFSVGSFTLFGTVGIPAPGSGSGGPAVALFPTADIATPAAGAVITEGTPITSIDVTFNDVNNDGLNTSQILSSNQKFQIEINGQVDQAITVNPTPTLVSGNTYAFAVSGFPTNQTGVVTIVFLPGTFSDGTGANAVQNLGSTEQFYIVAPGQTSPGPTATLASPAPGQPVTPATLNADGYIDVTYTSHDGNAIDKTKLNVGVGPGGTLAPFTLSGSGLGNVELSNGAPVIVGTPQLMSGTEANATSVTYRYYLQANPSTGGSSSSSSSAGLFQDGTVTLTFAANAFFTTNGTTDVAGNSAGLTQMFTISDSAAGGATTPKTISLGPLSLQGPTISVGNFGFKDGMLDMTITVGVNKASLAFGGASSAQSTSGVSVNLTGVVGTLEVQVDALGILSGKFRVNVPGNFSFRVASLTAQVPNVVNLSAQGIAITYNPAGPSNQQLVVINSAAISFPELNLAGVIQPVTTAKGTVPGLTVYENGFTLGEAELIYGVSGQSSSLSTTNGSPAISLGGIVTFNDIRIGVQDFSVTFGQTVTFGGSIIIGTGGATFLPGKPVSATIGPAPGAQALNGIPPVAMQATVTFNSSGQATAFQFFVGQMTVQLSSYVTLTATKFNLNTGAGPTDPIVSFSSVGATVKIGSLAITGSANNFAFLGNGSFETLPGFGVALTVGSATGGSFQWPSFLPIQIQSIGITWPDIQDDPANFTLTLSASVTSIGGLGGVTVTGAIQGIQIDPSLLAQGEFPITGLSSIAVTVQGDLFGGQIDAGLIGGILKLDSGFNIIAPTDTTTPVAHRVFYLGLEGGFTIDGMAGFNIQLGLSQLGPLDAFVSVSVPGGILLDPDTGLTINNFAGGVEFYKTLPSITDPMALNNPQFGVPTQLTAAQWLSSLQSQVAAQARATNGQANFLSAFTSPMTIIGSAEIYSIYTSQALFNGQVTVMISTDGKFLISGQLNFFNNNVSISGKLYVDLSQVTSGSVTVLFLANVPTQVQLLTIYGKLQMGFENAQGQPVTFAVAAPSVSPTAASTTPSATVSDPAPAGGSADVAAANGATADATSTDATYGAALSDISSSVTTASGQAYIDITYGAATGANLDYTAIMGNKATIGVSGSGISGTVAISGPIPVQTITLANGVLTVPLEYDARTNSIVTYGPNTETVLTVSASTNPSLQGDTDAQLIQYVETNAGQFSQFTLFDLTVQSQTVNSQTVRVVTDLAQQTVLAASSFSNGITTSQLWADALSDAGVTEFRYLLGSGVTFTPGTVVVTIGAGAVKNADTTDSQGNVTTGASNVATTSTVTIEGPTAVVVNPSQGGTIDINLLNGRNWVDIVFEQPDPSTGLTIDQGSITSGTPKFTFGGPGAGTLAVDTSQVPVVIATATDSVTYRFWLSGAPAATGAITLTFIPNSWTYDNAPAPAIPSQQVTFTPITGGGSVQSTLTVTIPDVPASGGTQYTPASLDLTTVAGFTVTDSNGTSITACGSQGATATACVTIAIQGGAAATQTSPGTFAIPIVIETLSGYTGLTTLTVTPQFTPQTVAYFAPAGSAPAAQAAPEYGGQLTAANFANQTYVDVQFAPVSGGQLISSTITNNAFTLGGAGASGITGFASGQNPIALGNGVYRFLLEGSFALGQVTVTFAANSVYATSARGPPCPTALNQPSGTDCYGNLAASQTFTVMGPTADLVQTIPGTNGSPSTVASLAGSSIGVNAINAQGYIEISFTSTYGNQIDPATINGNEIQITNSAGTVIPLSGAPVREGTSNTWRYGFAGQLAVGTYTVTFLPGSFGDTGGIVDQGSSEQFSVVAATATLSNPSSGTVQNQATLNGGVWVDVTFPNIGGLPIDPASLGAGNQISLADAANDTLVLVGTPVQLPAAGSSGTATFRYFFSGYSGATTTSGATNTITVTFKPGTWTGAGGTVSTTTDAPTDCGSSSATDCVISTGSWVDATLTPAPGQQVNAASVTAQTMTLSGAGLSSSFAAFSGTDPIVQVGPTTFRFLYSGGFVPGRVAATFAAGGWSDTAGNMGLASTQSFTVVAPAKNFFIELSGGLILNAAGFTSSPLLQITADVKLTVDTTSDPGHTVFSLSFGGQMSIYGLGTVGATSGIFTLDMSNTLSSVPQLWGAATLATNFSGLQKYGITIDATGTLEINTTEQEHIETLTLPGLGPNGSTATQTFDLQPLSFELALGGILAIQPPGSPSPLLSLNGALFLSINPYTFEIYATASLQYGVGAATVNYGTATGLLIVQTGLAPGMNPGVAGYLSIGAGASIGLPDVGSLFSITGTVTVMFNTTLQQQQFTVPNAFLPLLTAGQPSTITIYGSAPGPNGAPNPNAPAGGQIYVAANINAQITIGGVITLTGFIQIEVAAGSSGGELSITGAVGTSIANLGSLTGQLSLTMFIGSTPQTTGIVGRVFLTLSSSGIPGVALNGDFLVEINTFDTTQTIDTFAVNGVTASGQACMPDPSNPGSGCFFGGFQRDKAGNLVTTQTQIATGFHFEMYGIVTIGGIVSITANVDFTISPTEVSLLVNGSISLGPLGSVAIVDSGFTINSQGLVANINVSAGLGASFGANVGLSFRATAILQLNTTGRTQTIGATQVAPGFALDLSGSVDFLGFAQASGFADITIGPSGFQITFGLSFTLGPLTFTAKGGAGVYSNGIALDLQVSLNADATVFSITASGTLQINTTTQTELGIAPGSFYLAVSGKVDILKVLDFNASMTIFVGPDPNTGAEGYWSFNANASVSFFGLATLSGSIFLDSDGNFRISLSGQIVLGSSDFGLVGQFSIFVESQAPTPSAPFYTFELSGSASVSLNVFGISLAGLGVSFDFKAQGTGRVPITLSFDVSIHFLFWTIHKSASFTIGYLELPTPIFLAGAGGGCPNGGGQPGCQPQTWNGTAATPQPLILNVGNLAQFRNIGGDGTNDSYDIKQIGGTSTDATIQVNAFGRQETYQHVSSIVGDWSSQSCSATAPCSETIIVDPGVTVPVHITGSTGEFSDNTIEYGGNNNATTLTGGSESNDIVASGPSNVTIVGNPGGQPDANAVDIIRHTGTPGTATITSGAGNWFIVGGTSNDQITVGSGNNQIAGPAGTITLGSGANVVYITAGQGSTTINSVGVGTNTLNIIAAPGNDSLSGSGTGNIAISLTGGGSTGTYTISNGAIQHVVFQGSTGTDTFSGFNVSTSDSLDLGAPGAITIANSTFSSGALTISAGGALTLTGATVTSSASAALSSGTGLTATDSKVSAASGLGVAAGGDLVVQYVSSGSTLGSTAGDVSLTSVGGAVTISGTLVTASNGNVSVIGPGNISITAAVDSGGTAHPSVLEAKGTSHDMTLLGAGLVLVSGSSLISDNHAVSVTTTQGTLTLAGATLQAATSVVVDAAAGALIVQNAAGPSQLSGGSIALTASTTITFAKSSASAPGGQLTLTANGGTVTIGGSALSAGTALNMSAILDVVVETSTLGVAPGGSIGLTGARNVTLGSTTATGGALTLTATNGAVLASGSTLGTATSPLSSLTVTAHTTVSFVVTAVTSTGAISLTAAGSGVASGTPALALTDALLSGSSVSANATGALLVSQTSSVTGAQSVSLIATTTETVWQSSVGATAVGATPGSVTLTAQGGNLTLLIATVTASGSTTGTSPGQVLVSNGSNVSGNQGLTLTAGTNLSVTASTLASASGTVTLTASGGALTIDPSTVSAGGSVTGTSPDDISISGGASVTAGQSVSFTAGGALTVSGSSVTGTAGNVTLTANGGDLTLTATSVTSGAAMSGTATHNVGVEQGSGVTALSITLAAPGDVSLEASSLNAAGSPAAAVVATAGGNVLVDASSTVMAVATITLNGGQGGGADSITLDGSFNALVIEVTGGNGGDNILLSPVAVVGYTFVSGGTGADVITLHLPTIDLAHKFDPAVCTGGVTTCPAALVNGTAAELATMSRQVEGVTLPLRNMVNVDGGGGSDSYIVDMSGTSTNLSGTDYIVNIHDSGAPTDFNTLTINGVANAPNDFLLERNYVADLQPAGTGFLPEYERVNYDTTINLLHVIGGTAVDEFNVDDNSAITVLDGVAGNDTFQFGQLFGSQPLDPQNVAPGDAIATVDTTSGFLSAGVSYATTAYAGSGNATLTVYSNKATLKLFGEGGNNTFIVQAFQIVNSNSVATSNTQINTGNGNNLVEYNINAPVAIDGGSGYNTLVVIGTQGNDTFVITKDAVMGAGLNVSYTNISKIEVDGLGGNDTFDVLSTEPNVITVLEGGAGSDTFNVGGDVTTPVIALNANGTSGFINHSVSSADLEYNGIFAPGVPVSVASQTAGQVIINQIAGGTTVTQDGPSGTNQTTYTMALGITPSTPTTVWYITVAAAPDPSLDGGSSLELSSDGVHWSSALVLTFDAAAAAGSATDWNRTQTIFVRAISTTVRAGDQTIEIMSSVFSTTAVTTGLAGFNDIAISDVDVHVIDGDLPGLIVNVPPAGLNAIEGSASVVGTYTTELTKAPAAGETVTITLSADDARLRFSGPLTFNSTNWNIPQTVTVTAIDDGVVEGEVLATITAAMSSSVTTGGVYSNGLVDNPTVHINVIDGDSGGVLMLQPTGSTIVGPNQTAFYTIQLTKVPTAPVTVTILTDGKTLVSSGDSRFSATGGAGGAPAVVFDSSNWNVKVTLTVSVNPNAPAVVGEQPVQVFPAQPHVVAAIYGPLIIDGNETTPRTLVEAVMLPSEIDTPLPAPPPSQSDTNKVDTLNVFDDGSAPGYTGHLGAITAQELASLQTLYAPSLAAGLTQAQFGEIDGLGMGGPVTISKGVTTPLTFAGGITYDNLDVVDVMLGSSSNSVATEGLFTVSATVINSITVIQGGGGYKKLVATGGGGPNSPLILLGDTTQDGSFYNSTTANLTGEARVYSNPGQT